MGSDVLINCDVEDLASVDAAFAEVKAKWGTIDFLVHSIGFSDKNELKGKYADTTRANFSRTMVISAFSFTEDHEAVPLTSCPMAAPSSPSPMAARSG